MNLLMLFCFFPPAKSKPDDCESNVPIKKAKVSTAKPVAKVVMSAMAAKCRNIILQISQHNSQRSVSI